MPRSLIASMVGEEAVRNRKLRTPKSKVKGRFISNEIPQDRAGRLNDQCKFFGFKPKRFISTYANKPRILVKVKAKVNESRVTNIDYNDILAAERQVAGERQMAALYQQQMNMGIQNSTLAYQQQLMLNQYRAQHDAMVSAARQQSASHQLGMAQAMGMNGLTGMSDGLDNQRYQSQFLGGIGHAGCVSTQQLQRGY